MELFKIASHDVNPMHCSEEYAAKTNYSKRLCYGILGALGCLGKVLISSSDMLLSKLKLRFYGAMFPDICYQLESTNDSPYKMVLKMFDGHHLILKITAHFKSGRLHPLSNNSTFKPRKEALHLRPSDLEKEILLKGTYAPNLYEMRALVEQLQLATLKKMAEIHMAILLWSSYFVGMELPGRQALFSRLALSFEPLERPISSEFSYEAKLLSFDPVFHALKIQIELKDESTLLANGKIEAFLRPEPCTSNIALIKKRLSTTQLLKDKVALITGASRGLGATIAQALVLQGCTVLANFHKNRTEAKKVQRAILSEPGKIVLYQGDAADHKWCNTIKEKIVREYGKLDFLFCNACPGLLPLWIDLDSIERINLFINKSIALVSVPMAAFLNLLVETNGWNVVLSSMVTSETPQAEWPHYVAAKYAVEGLTNVAQLEYPQINFVLVRPPLLMTDLTHSPMTRLKATAPEEIAHSIVKYLLKNESQKTSQKVKILPLVQDIF
jgi:NAD(P)-dependent dehydrogenase (short-subunit alcohol dehydrogenase family)